MSDRGLHLHLDGYLSVREALGFQMRVERTLWHCQVVDPAS